MVFGKGWDTGFEGITGWAQPHDCVSCLFSTTSYLPCFSATSVIRKCLSMQWLFAHGNGRCEGVIARTRFAVMAES